MPTDRLKWPTTHKHLRDDMAELLRGEIAILEQITTNQVNDEEGMETIAAKVVSDLNVALRSLEKAEAATDPLSELTTRAERCKHISAPVMARA